MHADRKVTRMPEQEAFAIPRLRPQISLLAGVALAIGMVVGSGLFGLPGLALQAGSPQEAAVGWLVGAMASVPLVWVFAVLGARFASAAGLAYYAEIALGPSAAFAASSVLLGTFSLGVPGLAMIGASYALPFLGLEATALLPIAAVFILLAVLFNIAGVKTSIAVNGLSLLLMVLAVVLLGFLHPDELTAGVALWLQPDWSKVNVGEVWRISALLFWAFIGWESLSFGLEEFRDPQRTIRWVYMLSFGVVSLLYGALAAITNGAALSGLPMDRTESAAALVPAEWRNAFTLVIVVIILANANAWVFGVSRLVFAAGKSGLLPATVGRVDRRGLPRNAIILAGAFFALVLGMVKVFHLEIADLVMIVSQNFVVLYLVCLLCYWKVTRGVQRWIVTSLALVSCSFLLVGFNYRILYPIALFVFGIAIHRRQYPHHLQTEEPRSDP
jgi:amino acid transporter